MAEMAGIDRSGEEKTPGVNEPSAAVLEGLELLQQFPLGMFIVSGKSEKVQFNRAAAIQLGVDDSGELRVEEFWSRLCSLGTDPEQVSRAVSSARRDAAETGSGELVFRSRTGKYLEVRLVQLPLRSSREKDYTGWIHDNSRQALSHMAEIETLSEICGGTRMAAAGASGNLAALRENLRSWSPEVVADFLAQAVEQIREIQDSLDLALSYASLIRELPVFRQRVEPDELLAEIVGNDSRISARAADHPRIEKPLPAARIDLALTKLAVGTLLEELLRHNPPGIQVEAVLTQLDDGLVLKFISPRTLPLPGIGAKPGPGHPAGVPVKLVLARQLLSSQGIRVALQDRPLQEGGGADMEVYFPLEEALRQPSARQDLEDRDWQMEGRILLAEDQPDIQVRLREELTSLGYRVDLAGDGSTALDMVQTINPDLVILARNLPGMDGLLVTQGIRRWSAVPIIMISSRSGTDDQLYAYRLGVDDYLHKPILVEELLAKVRVFITRQRNLYQASLPEIYQSGSVRIDNSLHQVWIRGSLVDLTPIEYNLLLYLSRQGRQIVTYEQLVESVWEGPEKGTRQGLFVHVRRLREKVEIDPKNPLIIKNKWGVGYVFNP